MYSERGLSHREDMAAGRCQPPACALCRAQAEAERGCGRRGGEEALAITCKAAVRCSIS